MPKERIGIYPGTFDPLHYGHLDIIQRGLKLVDKMVIGVATNPSKTPMFSLDERVSHIQSETAGLAEKSGTIIEVEPFNDLLMHFAERVNAGIIIRGLRAVSDFEYEFQMAGMNSEINPDIETVFLMADAPLQSIASRLVKEVASYGGKIDSFAPPGIVEDIKNKLK